MKKSMKVAEDQFGVLYGKIKEIGETKILAIQDQLESAGAPYTPGKLPEWK